MKISYETSPNGLMRFEECEFSAENANLIFATRHIYKIETEGNDTQTVRNIFKDTIPWAFSDDTRNNGQVCDKQVWCGDIARTIVESLKLQQMKKPTSEELKVKILNSLTPKKY
jgi:hypothetical protein